LVKVNNYKFIKPQLFNPFISANEKIIKTNIEPSNFSQYPNDPLEKTNERWFVNLSDYHIPKKVSNLLQLGDRFSLSSFSNTKRAIHEIVKDIESNIKAFYIDNQIKIRNTIIPHFHKFLHIKTRKNTTNQKVMSLVNYTRRFCHKNPNVIFTRADKGNTTIAFNKVKYINAMEEALKDINRYTIVNKDPTFSIEKKLNDVVKLWYREEYF